MELMSPVWLAFLNNQNLLEEKDIRHKISWPYVTGMCFTFALPGWEGTAHDARVFCHALTTPTMNFPHPPPGFYFFFQSPKVITQLFNLCFIY